MPHTVLQEIKVKATRCEKDLACTKEDGKPNCQVEDVVGHELAWVRCLCPEPCAYQLAFGTGYICTCPVRLYIWENWHI